MVITTNERHKKRLVIDYSQTVNRFTQLTAYPLPRIDELVNNVAKYRYFSTIDLRSAYHQIPLSENDKLYSISLRIMIMHVGVGNVALRFAIRCCSRISVS